MRKREYVYGVHYAPHDIEVREFTTGISRKDLAKNLGVNFRVVANIPLDEGINLARNVLPKCWFDKDKTKKGVECLRNYHKEWDDKNRCFRSYPAHDWSSHGSDAFRYFAVQEAKKVKSENMNFYQRPFYDKNKSIWANKNV